MVYVLPIPPFSRNTKFGKSDRVQYHVLNSKIEKYVKQNTSMPGSGCVPACRCACVCARVHLSVLVCTEKLMAFTELAAPFHEPRIWF